MSFNIEIIDIHVLKFLLHVICCSFAIFIIVHVICLMLHCFDFTVCFHFISFSFYLALYMY